MVDLKVIEGQIVETVDSAESVPRIKEGLWLCLEKDGALDLHWDGPILRFRGPSGLSWRVFDRSRKLRELMAGELSFQEEGHQLQVGFRLTFRGMLQQFLIFGLAAISALALQAIGVPTPLSFLLAALLFSPACRPRAWLSLGSRARDYFQTAMTRGLTEVAIRELETLRAQSAALPR